MGSTILAHRPQVDKVRPPQCADPAGRVLEAVLGTHHVELRADDQVMSLMWALQTIERPADLP